MHGVSYEWKIVHKRYCMRDFIHLCRSCLRALGKGHQLDDGLIEAREVVQGRKQHAKRGRGLEGVSGDVGPVGQPWSQRVLPLLPHVQPRRITLTHARLPLR
jgi:hypothetical protein